jgi:hypothetical protein
MNKKLKLSLFTALYGVLFLICLYKNTFGAMYPLLVIGTVIYIGFSMKAAGQKLKFDAYGISLVAAAFLLGVSHIFTANFFVHFFNGIGIFLALFLFSTHVFNDDKDWAFIQNVKNLITHVSGAFSHFTYIFKDFKKGLKESEPEGEKPRKSVVAKIILTILATIPAFMIILSLLSIADPVFAQVTEKIVDNFIMGDWLFIPIMFIFVICFSYGIIRRALTKPLGSERIDNKNIDSIIAITVSIMFDIIYVMFSMIQIVYLFIGGGTLPEGYTYAEYAREGFGQLLVVAVFNFIIIILGNTLFKKNVVLKITQTVMSVCTYIMIVSSLMRLILYIRYYYFTFMRVLAFWALLTLAVLFVGVMIQIWNERFNMFKYLVIGTYICYMVLAFSRCDYYIAKANLSQAHEKNSFFLTENNYNDTGYFWDLSYDALPVIMEDGYFIGENDYHLERIKRDLDAKKVGIRSYNYSLSQAKKIVKQYNN